MSDTHLRQALRPQLDDLRARGLYKSERQLRMCIKRAHLSGDCKFARFMGGNGRSVWVLRKTADGRLRRVSVGAVSHFRAPARQCSAP